MEWNVDEVDGLMGSHLIITTSEQTPPLNRALNKDLPNYLASMIKYVNHLQEKTTCL